LIPPTSTVPRLKKKRVGGLLDNAVGEEGGGKLPLLDDNPYKSLVAPIFFWDDPPGGDPLRFPMKKRLAENGLLLLQGRLT